MTLKSVFITVSLVAMIGAVHAQNADLYVAADNQAVVYLNGNIIGRTLDWRNHIAYTLTVKEGDLIEVTGIDLGAKYGVIAALVSRSNPKKRCITKPRHGPWTTKDKKRATTLFPVRASIKKGDPGSATFFPYRETGAQYVWARDAGEGDIIQLQLKVTSACF